MNGKLYFEDAYIKDFEAVVTEVKSDNDSVKIKLDRTAFYPEGGGQPADHGFLLSDEGKKVMITDVRETDGVIWHFTDSEILLPGEKVRGCIDWDRRFDHMQQHSGEHIVSGMICRRFNCDNVGFHLGEDVVTIDFNTRITYEEALEIEDRANRYIWENHPFIQMWPDEHELNEMEYRSKKELSGNVRITSFEGADTCACCGTHVSGSAQVGMVKFISARNFHEGTRLELLCGKRAMEFLSVNHRENKKSAVLLSSKEGETSGHVKKLIDENIRLKADAAALQDRLFEEWADSCEGYENVIHIEDQIGNIQAKDPADLMAGKCSRMAAVFVKNNDRYNYALINKGADISGFVREMNQALNGRGGGRNGFAQGSVSADRNMIEQYFEGYKIIG